MRYAGESAYMAMSALKSCRQHIINMSSYCSDETYRFVTRRENDITVESYARVYDSIVRRVEDAL